MAAVFSEDVEEFASQTRLPGFNQALSVDHQSTSLPVLMASHYILKSWVEDRTSATLDGPRLRIKGQAAPLDLYPRILVQDLLDLDFHLCVGSFIMS